MGGDPALTTRDYLFLAGVSLAYLVLSLSLLLSWPLLSPDEAIFADTARNVLVSGHPSTTLVIGMEAGSSWQPPGWFYCMAPVIGIFGYDLLPLRVVSMLVGLLIVWATFLLARQLNVSLGASKAAVLLLALNPNFVTYVKYARMDGLCVLFTVLGLALYANYCVGGKIPSLAGGSALFGLALLFHPLGMIGPATAGCHLLLGPRSAGKKSFSTLLWIILPIVLAAAVWFLSASNPADFWTQFKFQMERKSRPFPASPLSFAERYRSLPLFGVLIPVGLLGAWRRVRRLPSTLSWLFAFGVTIATTVVALVFETPYHVYCLPLLSIACALLFETWRDGARRRHLASRAGLIAVLCNFMAYVMFFNFVFHGPLRDATDYTAFTRRIADEIPEGATVCIAGYPCAYWGLRGIDRRYHLIEEAFLSDSIGIEALKKAEWFVAVNGLDPADDAPDVLSQIEMMKRYAKKADRTWIFKGFIGERKRFAYTARIFQLLPK